MADSEQLFELKRQVRKLAEFRGSGTELISVYIPAGYPIHETVNKLREEISQAGNIKSKTTRNNVISALERIVQHLKLFKQTPQNGMVVFAGNISNDPSKTVIELFSLEPPQPINMSIYRCDSRFFLEPLERMSEVKDSYGVVVLDGREATLAIVRGTEITIVKKLNSTAHAKIKVGGQCLAAGTLLVKDDGEIIDIGNFKPDLKIMGIDFSISKTIAAVASDLFMTPAKHSFFIETKHPRCEIRATPYHRFFVVSEHGIKEKFAKDLAEGDRLLIARKINCKGGFSAYWTEEVARLFGVLYGTEHHPLLKRMAAREKDIPKEITTCNNRIVAAFLSGMYDAKADIHRNRLDIATVNKTRMQKVQVLLLRFGILSSLAEKKVGGKRQWVVSISDRNALLQFKKHIGFTLNDKKEKLEKICKRWANQQCTDNMPIDGREVLMLAKELGLKRSDFKVAGYFFRSKKPFSREVFARDILSVFAKHRSTKKGRRVFGYLSRLYHSDLSCASIKRKTLVKHDENFYDITIPIHSNFIANGFVVHNSARRYQRLIEESIEKYYMRIGEAMDSHFLGKVKAVIIGGPGPTKDFFMKARPFNYQLKVLGVVDTGYTEEYGIREALSKSESLIENQEAIKEKILVERFIKEVVKEGLATYGEKEVESAILSNQAELVLLSEGLPHKKYFFKCSSCDQQEGRISKEPILEISCQHCGGRMKIEKEELLMDHFFSIAKEKGIKVEVISTNTAEGSQFLYGFGGIGAFLRYKRQ